MLSPIHTMFLHFPFRAYSTVFALVFVSVYAFRHIWRRCKVGFLSRQRGVLLWLLLNYILLLLFLAVLGRRSLEYYRFNFEPGYSYRQVLSGDLTLAPQIMANIAVFVPVGALGSLTTKRRGFLKGLMLGVGLSLCIELLQLVMRNGTCEVDDLISNALGTLLGCILAAGCGMIMRGRSAAKEKHSEDGSEFA